MLVLVAAVNAYVRLRSEPASPLPPPAPLPARAEADPVPQVVVHPVAAAEIEPSADRKEPQPDAGPAAPGSRRGGPRRGRARRGQPRSRPGRGAAPSRPRDSSRRPSIRPRSTRPRRASSPCGSAIPRPRSRRWRRGAASSAPIFRSSRARLAALRSLPRPKATSILTKSPVARPTSSDEFHFELRRGRISFIDLERLLELAKSDAQVRIRMSDRSGLITSQVGPVRSFSLAYVLGRADGGHRRADRAPEHPLRPQGLGADPRVRAARRDLRGDPKPDLRIHPRRQPAHPGSVGRHVLGLPRQLSRSIAAFARS